jgi:hypothetical protein
MRILLSSKKLKKYELPNVIPNDLLNEDWAINIHGQSLDRLNQRGGMAPNELIGNIKKLNRKEISIYPEKNAILEIRNMSYMEIRK